MTTTPSEQAEGEPGKMFGIPIKVSPLAGEKQYRKKPVVVEAAQLTDNIAHNREVAKWCGAESWQFGSKAINIQTLEGTMKANVGDYIIKGVNGEFYPCKPDIFNATYEEVKPDTGPTGIGAKLL